MEEEKYKYQYVDPIEQGYKRFYVTRKQHKEIFKDYTLRASSVQLNWKCKWEYYYKDDQILLHKFGTIPVKILTVLMYPFYVAVHGLGELKELHKEYKGIFNEKETGAFLSEHFTLNSGNKIYEKFVELIKKTGQ